MVVIKIKKIPFKLMAENNPAVQLNLEDIPSAQQAFDDYNIVRGRLTESSTFGNGTKELQERREFTFKQCFSYRNLYHNTVNSGDELQRAIMYFISLTDYYHNMI